MALQNKKELQDCIKVHGARVHNLKNIDVDIPKNKLVVITGVSGSGKSSLAFDTLYAEGQRRYVESLSAYARQFLGVMEKPDAERIEGLSPAISIDQKSVSKNPRSTVGTITEIYDYLRLLFSRIGKPHCPNCAQPVSRQTPSHITTEILRLVAPRVVEADRRRLQHRSTLKAKEYLILAPIIQDRKGEHKGVLEEIKRAGFVRVRFDGQIWEIDELLARPIDKQKKHTLEVVVDRIESGEKDRSRIAASVETALKMGKGLLKLVEGQRSTHSTGHSTPRVSDSMSSGLRLRGSDSRRLMLSEVEASKISARGGSASGGTGQMLPKEALFSEHFACPKCHINLPPIEPRTFSFNSPYGACPECTGLGSKIVVDPELVIPNKNLTLAEGAIRPWMTASHRVGRQGFYWWMLHELSERHGFSLDRPVKELPERIIKIILVGDDNFEGVIKNLERRWRETDSEFTRAEIEKYMVIKTCELCHGKRLRQEALAVKIRNSSIVDICDAPIKKMNGWITDVSGKLSLNERKIAQLLLREISRRTQFLIEVGLDYLTLSRASTTLAGGEAQRIRLATQIGSGLTGVLYILDEPSVGLHARDQGRLIKTLKHLRDLGNSVIVVEHDPQTIREADWIIDIGPGAGDLGGKVVFMGTPQALTRAHTLTGEYLSGRKKVSVNRPAVTGPVSSYVRRNSLHDTGIVTDELKTQHLIIKGAQEHNLKNIDVRIPLGKFVCVAGVSGSGKSTLVDDILARSLFRYFYQARLIPGEHKAIDGLDYLDKVVLVDQSPIGRTPRSNPATYTGAFTYMRELFSKTPLARMRGYSPGRFSFNVKGGRCEACEGQGSKKIEMYFLEDVYVECEECRGKRYNPEALEVEWNGLNIAEVLGLSISKALKSFSKIPALADKLRTLEDVGLGYMKLGQPAPTLSGGEAQRVKLATELSRRSTGRTLYILDEPTTGLHFDDVQKLLNVLSRLVEMGNTVLVIEHNLDVLKNADWILELGPEGGEGGGEVVAEGTPEEIAKNSKSPTGKYLRSILEVTDY